jgi:tetratricopeptide (TPR) repeat protein
MHDAANLSRATLVCTFVLLLGGTRLGAQSTTELIEAGDRENAARHPALALPFFERALQTDPRNYVALWKASRELVDLGEVERNGDTRASLYARAVDYARRAVALEPNDAEGHFHLARGIGRTALSVGPRERVKYGVEVRHEALKALEFAPRHPGALHVMGVWNAEIMRLNGFTRMLAKTFLGGKVFDTASWAEATRYMELSVTVEPTRLVHRLDLARVYRDTGRKADARAAYAAAIALPLLDANDDMYRRDAEREMAAMKN